MIECEDQFNQKDENNETILDFFPSNENIEISQFQIQNQEADLYIQINNKNEILKNDQLELSNPQERKLDQQLRKKANLKKKRKKRKKKRKIIIIAKENLKDKVPCNQSLIDVKNKFAKIILNQHKNKFSNLLQSNVTKGNDKIVEQNDKKNNNAQEVEKSPRKIIYKRKSLKPIIGSQLKQIKNKEDFADRLMRIRKNFIDKQLHNFTHEKIYSYIILPGNACYQINNCMKHRVNWREAQTQVTSMFNFKWKPTRLCIDYNSLSITKSIPQIVNHFEFHSSITKKSDMFMNLFSYCEINKINVFKYVPFTILHSLDSEIGHFETLFNNINNYLVDYESMCKYQEVNKKVSYSSLFGFFGSEVGYRAPITIPKHHYKGKNMWVIKATNLNRGQCIRVVDSIENLKKVIKTFQGGIKFLPNENLNDKGENEYFNKNVHQSQEIIHEDKKEKEKDPEYQTDKIIIQKYIENPLLYQGRKCDIRIWVLVTQNMEGFVFKEGHLKTCSVDYDLSVKDSSVHITNYSYQKYCDNFSKFEIGNEVPFHDFQSYLDSQYQSPSISIKNDIMPKIKEIIKASLLSVKDKLNSLKRNYSFELFGYDFMIDSNLDVYLIEINTNPGIEESSPWIKVIIPRMLDDCLRLTIDKLFFPKYSFTKNNKINEKTNNHDKLNSNTNKNSNNILEKSHSEIKKAKNITEEYYQQEMHSDQENERNQQYLFDMEKLTMMTIDDDNSLVNNDHGDIKKENVLNTEVTSEDKKNDKSYINNPPIEEYISPYPVPRYTNSENLWDFVCDLNDKKVVIKKEYTGIKHLLLKKKDKDKDI